MVNVTSEHCSIVLDHSSLLDPQGMLIGAESWINVPNYFEDGQ